MTHALCQTSHYNRSPHCRNYEQGYLSRKRDSILRNIKRVTETREGRESKERHTVHAAVSLQLQHAQIAIANHEAAGRLHGALKVDR